MVDQTAVCWAEWMADRRVDLMAGTTAVLKAVSTVGDWADARAVKLAVGLWVRPRAKH